MSIKSWTRSVRPLVAHWVSWKSHIFFMKLNVAVLDMKLDILLIPTTTLYNQYAPILNIFPIFWANNMTQVQIFNCGRSWTALKSHWLLFLSRTGELYSCLQYSATNVMIPGNSEPKSYINCGIQVNSTYHDPN